MDTERYLDVPFVDGGRDLSGWDCWGCVRYVSAQEFGRDLPAFDWAGIRDGRVRAQDIARDVERNRSMFDRVERPASGDIVLLTPRGRPSHVGIVVVEKPVLMLHAERSFGTAVERVYGPVWRHRLEGFYRYNGEG